MPIATKGAIKNLLPEEVRLGAEIILGNTYHLWLRPGDEIIKRAGGLHKFMNWEKPILTDSGGFQIFSLGARAKNKYGKNGVKLTEKGVYFSDPIDGKKYFMTPEKSIDIQLNIRTDRRFLNRIRARGRTSTNERTSALITRFSWGVMGSLENTSTALAIGPEKAAVSTSARILPVVPGAIERSKSATVQPQVGRTWVISRGA